MSEERPSAVETAQQSGNSGRRSWDSANPLSVVTSAKKIGRHLLVKYQAERINACSSPEHKLSDNCNVSSPISSAVLPGQETLCNPLQRFSTPSAPTRIDHIDQLQFNLFRGNSLRGTPSPVQLSVFFFELFAHVFYPISIPVVIAVQGVNAAANRGYLPRDIVFVGQLGYSLVFFVPLAFWAASPEKAAWAVPSIIIGSAYTAFRMLVTAGKYACFKKSKYRLTVEAPYDCPKDLLLNMIEVDADAVDEMLAEAERDSGIRLQEMYFLLADGVTSVNARVYALSLARSVYLSCDRGRMTFHHTVRTPIAIIAALYPIERFMDHCSDKGSAFNILLLIFNVVQTLMYASVVFGFLGFSILHYHRLKSLRVAHVSALLFTGSAITKIALGVPDDVEDDDESGDIAMIPACSAENLVVWATVGNVLTKFAETTTNRVCFNVAANLFVCLILAGALIMEVWQNQTRDLGFILIISFTFAVTAVGTLLCVVAAFLANRQELEVVRRLEEENFAFLWRERMIRQQSARASKTGGAPDTTAVAETYVPFLSLRDHPGEAVQYKETMDIVREMIQRRNDIDPVKVMYAPASIEMLSFVGSLVVSGALLVVGAIYQSVPGWES